MFLSSVDFFSVMQARVAPSIVLVPRYVTVFMLSTFQFKGCNFFVRLAVAWLWMIFLLLLGVVDDYCMGLIVLRGE